MAVDDFYSLHNNYATRIVLQALDSKQSVVGAAAAAMDLMKNGNVVAVIGPATSGEAEFVALLGNATKTPIVSFSASSGSLSVTTTLYFIRATVRDSDQSPVIADIVKNYGWHEVVSIFEDSDYGFSLLPSLTDALQSVDARVTYRAALSPSASHDRISGELYRLKTLSARVFIVHMMPSLASRFFRLAASAGMLAEGYAWIVTDGVTNVVDMLGAVFVSSMEGAIGVKPHVPSSPELDNFTARWRARFLRENPEEKSSGEPSLYQLWAYDATQAVAAAVEKAFTGSNFTRRRERRNDTFLSELGVFEAGPQLLAAIRSTDVPGLSGEFRLVDGELNPPPFEIVNFVGNWGRTVGFWTPATGITGKLGSTRDSPDAKLKTVIWPGESTVVPKGWGVATGGKKLRIAVPVKNGFTQFVNVQRDPTTNEATISGYCIDVFDAVMADMPYSVSYEYIPFKDSAASYDDLVEQVHYNNFDAVVGDTTILAKRSDYVQFTLPYTESGVALLVPLQQDNFRNAWIFLKPLTTDLWFGTFTFFFFTGLIVWAIEHRINKEFHGSLFQQIGITLYFIFSTLVFSHKEKLESNLSKLVVIIWVFLVLILTSSYTASLTSMLTVQQMLPRANNITQLLHTSKARVGYQDGSFVLERLLHLGFTKDRLQNYSTMVQYKDAMLKGTDGGGVAAIFDEIPYINLFLSEYCGADFAMVGMTYKTDGFGFVFPKGSSLVPDVSRAILNVTEGDSMNYLKRKWFGDQKTCLAGGDGSVGSSSLDCRNFGGLFLITGSVSIFCLLVYIGVLIWNEWRALRSASITVKDGGGSIWNMMAAWAKHCDDSNHESSVTTSVQSPLSTSGTSGAGFVSSEMIVSERTSTTERLQDDLLVI